MIYRFVHPFLDMNEADLPETNLICEADLCPFGEIITYLLD